MLKQLQTIARALPKNSQVPSLDGFCIDGNTVIASNLDFTIIAELDRDYGECVADKKLLETLKRMPDADIQIDDVITFKSKSSKVKLNKISEVEEYPTVDDVTEWPSFEVDADLLKDAISKTAPFASTEQEKVTFMGVYWQGDNMTASDTFRLATVSLGVDTDIDVLIPAKYLLELARIIEGKVKVYHNDKKVAFKWDGYTAILSLISGKYPDLTQILSQKPETLVTVNKEEFREGAERTTVVMDAFQTIKIEGSDKLYLKTEGESGQAEAEVEAEIRGSQFEVYFNINFILQPLKLIEGDEAELGISGPQGAFRLEQDGFKYLALPVKREAD